jgi:transposase InsO family protein
VSRFRFISEQRAVFGVKRLCRVLGVHRSGFYAFMARGRPAGHPQRPGRSAGGADPAAPPRHHRHLRVAAGHRRAARPRRGRQALAGGAADARARGHRGPPAPPASHHPPRPGRPGRPRPAGRDFTAAGPDQRWCGDITYLRVADRFLYLAPVLDLHSRRLVGWSLADHARAELAADALEAAVATRGGTIAGVVFHTDHGAQYTAAAFAELCDHHGVVQSMGPIGDSLDNAVAESFFATLNRELGGRWASVEQARLAVFSWIAFYNYRRRPPPSATTAPSTTRRSPPTSSRPRHETRCPPLRGTPRNARDATRVLPLPGITSP